MVSPAVQGQVRHPPIVPEFLRSTSCGMTSARGHGAIVYCLNSGSGDSQTGRHNGLKREKKKDKIKVGENGRKRKGERGQEKSGENGRKENGEETRGEDRRDGWRRGLSPEIGVKKTNAGGVENGNMN
ncbi:hypothetical protein TNCV_1409791 [Trichonephila clavipes]|uniref:Uncharacterized protein n=1 Tax=Trichonephila clavipes TaxID=2585209 RepID=A0A8X6R6L3_TRICX|nr:hypothetical protein TNCV_1409791 [Trichonephila clavipes]